MYRLALTLSLTLLAPLPAFAQRDAKIPDPDPEIERKSFIVAPGFEVTLWAADPLLAKPIQMNWDPQGRLWVSTSEVYPQIEPGQKANDKVIILEDTTGAGKADKTTVFADGLLIPTGIVPGDGGAYVANSTEIVHLSASKPGGKADKSRVVLSGFGTEDTHHIIHTFRWGPDGCLYFNQSVYIHSHIETPTGVQRLNAGGIWRFRPETNDLSVFARGWVNAWGHAFDKFGQSLVTDGAGGEGINHAIPGSYFMESKGPNAGRILHGLNPGSPKYCGLEILSGRHIPDDWQGDLITNDFRGHRVCRFKLQDDGSTFASRELSELIKTAHPAFRPIDVKMGPDGAIYIADWYNPIIQHGEVDFRDPRRDHTHGRIWRVAVTGRPLVPKPELVTATVPQLLDRLKDLEQWTRDQSRILLRAAKHREVRDAIDERLKTLDKTDSANQNLMMEYMWALCAHGDRHTELVLTLAKSKDFRIRAAAARLGWDLNVLENYDTTGETQKNLIVDEHPRVRLESLRVLAKGYSAQHFELVLKALEKPMDRVLDYALWLTIRELEPEWLPQFIEGNIDFDNDPKKIAFALNASARREPLSRSSRLARCSGKGILSAAQSTELWELLARIGGPDDMRSILVRCLKPGMVSAERVRLLSAVEEAVQAAKGGIAGRPGRSPRKVGFPHGPSCGSHRNASCRFGEKCEFTCRGGSRGETG